MLTGADGADSVEVRGWNVETKTRLVARQQSVRSDTVTPGMSPSTAAKMFGSGSRTTIADTPYRTQAETRAVAGALAASVSAGFGEVEAVAYGNPQLRAGMPVALGNVGPAFSGRYTATAAHHVLEPDTGYRTTVIVSASPDRSLSGLASGGNAPRAAPACRAWRSGWSPTSARRAGANAAGCG